MAAIFCYFIFYKILPQQKLSISLRSVRTMYQFAMCGAVTSLSHVCMFSTSVMLIYENIMVHPTN